MHVVLLRANSLYRVCRAGECLVMHGTCFGANGHSNREGNGTDSWVLLLTLPEVVYLRPWGLPKATLEYIMMA